jgi:hypothetical protein
MVSAASVAPGHSRTAAKCMDRTGAADSAGRAALASLAHPSPPVAVWEIPAAVKAAMVTILAAAVAGVTAAAAAGNGAAAAVAAVWVRRVSPTPRPATADRATRTAPPASSRCHGQVATLPLRPPRRLPHRPRFQRPNRQRIRQRRSWSLPGSPGDHHLTSSQSQHNGRRYRCATGCFYQPIISPCWRPQPRTSSATTRKVSTDPPTSNDVTRLSRHASRSSRTFAGGPTRQISSIMASGTAATASA